jgi:hypothetical protein
VQEPTELSVPRVQDVPDHPLPRVQQDTTAHITITPTVQRTARRRRQLLYHAATPVHLPTQPPALSTRSCVKASQPPPPRTSRIPKPRVKPPVPTRRSSRRSQANAVTAFREGDFHKAFKRLEKQVHQALAVLDKESGKQLNYRQLLAIPNTKKNGVDQLPTNSDD